MSRRGTSKKEKLIPRRGRGTAEKEKLIPRRGRGTAEKEKLIPRRGRGTAEKEKLIPRRGRGTAEKEKLIPRRGRGTAEKKTSKYDKKKCLPTKYDPIYRKKVILMLGNRILKHGKKSLAYKILYRAMKEMKQKTEIDPISVLRQAIEKVTPRVALQTRAKRTGEGSTYQVPKEVAEKEGRITAIRWLLKASRKRTGQNMAFRLSSEFVDATKKRGNAIRKKEEIYKMTQATRTFAYVRESLHF